MDQNSEPAAGNRSSRRRNDVYPAPQRVSQAAEQMNSWQPSAMNPNVPYQSASPVNPWNGQNGPENIQSYYRPEQRGWNPQEYYQRNVTGNANPNGMYRDNAVRQPNPPVYPNTGWQRGYQPSPIGNMPAGAYDQGNRPAESPKKIHWGRIAGILAAVIAVVVAVFIGVKARQEEIRRNETDAIVIPYNTKYCPGVYVDGIHLGGLEHQQAYDAVMNQLAQYYGAWSVCLKWNEKVLFEFTADQLGMVPQVEDALNEAWKQGHLDPYGKELTAEERRSAMEQLALQPFAISTARADHDTSLIDNILEQAKMYIDREAQNAVLAEFRPDNENDPFVIQDEVIGLRLDIEPIREQLYSLANSLTSATIELIPEEILPDITKEDIQRGISLRGSATTPISRHSTEDRNNNIRRAFESVSGVILQPGKQFSFNNTVGERTTANGFFKAVEYAYGEHVEGVGGGVCQASTTIYQAAVSAGLEIVKREPHSDAVSYTDYGKDATVYWNGKRKIDFVFKNNTDSPIYLVASVLKDPSNKNRLIAKVSIYGQDLGNVRYELQSSTIKILDPPDQPEYVKDKNAEYVKYTDQQKSVSKASEGYVVESYRVKYEDNTMVEKRLLYTDTYEPKPEKIYVGVSKRK